MRQKRREKTSIGVPQPRAQQQLPEPVLVMILQHVPLQQRLACCSLVCRSWAAAVACTTTHVEVETKSAVRWQQVQDYLQHCGGQVVSINMMRTWFSDKVFLQLPCSKLTRLTSLKLDGIVMQLHTGQLSISTRSSCSRNMALTDGPPALSSNAVIPRDTPVALLPQLQQLQLSSCTLSLQNFRQLSHVTALTSLGLECITITKSPSSKQTISGEQGTAALSTILQHLPKLAQLTLQTLGVEVGPLSAVSSLRHLQRLSLDKSSCGHLSHILQHLPTALTALKLHRAHADLPATHLAYASRLGRLQELILIGLDLTPAFLSSLTALRYLELEGVEASVAAPPPAAADDASAYNLEALLAALGKLKQLQHLELVTLFLAREPGPDMQHFSAITASSQLTELCIQHDYGVPLPAAALEHMLPAGKQLLQLRTLRLENNRFDSNLSSGITGAGMERIAAGCPGLTSLTLQSVVVPGADVSSLLKLRPSLRSLSVEGEAFGDGAAVTVAQLTNLESVCWKGSPLTDAGLMCLSNLRGLTQLETGGWAMSFRSTALLESTAPAGEEPNLWQALARMFGPDSQS